MIGWYCIRFWIVEESQLESESTFFPSANIISTLVAILLISLGVLGHWGKSISRSALRQNWNFIIHQCDEALWYVRDLFTGLAKTRFLSGYFIHKLFHRGFSRKHSISRYILISWNMMTYTMIKDFIHIAYPSVHCSFFLGPYAMCQEAVLFLSTATRHTSTVSGEISTLSTEIMSMQSTVLKYI